MFMVLTLSLTSRAIDVCLAVSNLMGIKKSHEFDRPFKSRDLKEFWNRWHMSLSFCS